MLQFKMAEDTPEETRIRDLNDGDWALYLGRLVYKTNGRLEIIADNNAECVEDGPNWWDEYATECRSQDLCQRVTVDLIVRKI